MSEPIHQRMARTVLEMITSGDVTIIHPGPNWGVQLNAVLTEEDIDTLLTYAMKDTDK